MGKAGYLAIALILSGCGVSATSREKSGATEQDAVFYVAQFFPAAGEVADLPVSITVTFNEVPRRSTLAALTHYNLNCGGETHAASAVDSTSGFGSATVTLPNMGALDPGTDCTFVVSPGILDESGNRLGGLRAVTYTVTD